MPENLRITTPVPTGDAILKPNATPEQTPRVDAVDPSRVNQPSTREQKPDGQSLDLLLNSESVFGKFIQQFRQTPGLSQTLEKLLFDLGSRQERLAQALPEDSPLRLLSKNIASGKADMVQDLLFQQKEGTRFSGGFFRLLGMISEQAGDGSFDLHLADFLKAFDGFQSAPNTLLAILSNLQSIERQLPRAYAKQLHDAVQELPFAKEVGTQDGEAAPAQGASAQGTSSAQEEASFTPLFPQSAGEVGALAGQPAESQASGSAGTAAAAFPGVGEEPEANLEALKKSILPLLSEYVSKSSDYGKAREDISLLLHNVSILNVSTKENLEEQFAKLLSYCRHSLHLSDGVLRQMQALSEEEFSANMPKTENKFFQALLPTLAQGMKEGAAGFDRAVYQDITHSLLLDNSVYMPFAHYYLPVVIQGRSLFAQLWVEKRQEDENHGPRLSQSRAPSSLFLTFDIQGLGYFEAAVTLSSRRADIHLNCPPALLKRSGEIVPDISQILRQNGFTAGEVRVASSEKPEVPNLLLQKIHERKRIIDVTV